MLKQEFGDSLDIEWRAFMLRPEPSPRRLDDFRKYTEKWQHVADEQDSGSFRVWSTDEGPPTHSLPPHQVAKAAARVSEEAFERMHDDLLRAYFYDSRDITSPQVLEELWEQAGLSPADLAIADAPDIRNQVIDEHNEAVACGANGAPAFRTSDNDTVLVGAHPMHLFRRWVANALGREERA